MRVDISHRNNNILYTSIFSHHMEAIVFIIFQIVLKRAGKCLQTAYCLLREILTFQCFCYDLRNNQTCPFFRDNRLTFSYLELHFNEDFSQWKQGLENEKCHLGILPDIEPYPYLGESAEWSSQDCRQSKLTRV